MKNVRVFGQTIKRLPQTGEGNDRGLVLESRLRERMKTGSILTKETLSLAIDVKPLYGFLIIIYRINVPVTSSDLVEPSCFPVVRSFFNPLPQNFDNLDSFPIQKDRPGSLLASVAGISNDINPFFRSLLQFPIFTSFKISENKASLFF